jgi:putative transposase
MVGAPNWDAHVLGLSLAHSSASHIANHFEAKLKAVGITGVRTPVRAPNANSVAERLVRTLRQECLDHVVIVNERHLFQVLREFIECYNCHRPHRSLGFETPVPTNETRNGAVVSRPVLGGLHHVYARAA